MNLIDPTTIDTCMEPNLSHDPLPIRTKSLYICVIDSNGSVPIAEQRIGDKGIPQSMQLISDRLLQYHAQYPDRDYDIVPSPDIAYNFAYAIAEGQIKLERKECHR